MYGVPTQKLFVNTLFKPSCMRQFYFAIVALFLSICSLEAQSNRVAVVQDNQGMKLQVNGSDFMVNGMNWDYFPIGTNFSYSLWNQPDDIVMAALDDEMSLLKNMGVNSVRIYTGIPARWITYIYQKYGIHTMLNHSFGRYGLTLENSRMANTEYSDPRVKSLLIKEVTDMVRQYKGTPGVLLYLLGNENNYGLFWGGAETEDIPVEDHESTTRAIAMYKLFNEATLAMKKIDTSVPIAICNGDLLFLEIIKEECKDIDIFGTNMYRGSSFGDAFERVKNELNKPILFTEFGADAFNSVENAEDQESQAFFMVENWKEIYENAAGLGKAGNSLGGFTFQFSDGWWKTGQTKDLEVHNSQASWSNGGYFHDFVEGKNNMNEEWFGIMAKGKTNPRGLYSLYPRAAYYALQEVHKLNPYSPGMTLEAVQNHFAVIDLVECSLKAKSRKSALQAESSKLVSLNQLRAQFTPFHFGGSLITALQSPVPNPITYPYQLGLDPMHSFFVVVEANPTSTARNVVFNVLGNVALTPLFMFQTLSLS